MVLWLYNKYLVIIKTTNFNEYMSKSDDRVCSNAYEESPGSRGQGAG